MENSEMATRAARKPEMPERIASLEVCVLLLQQRANILFLSKCGQYEGESTPLARNREVQLNHIHTLTKPSMGCGCRVLTMQGSGRHSHGWQNQSAYHNMSAAR